MGQIVEVVVNCPPLAKFLLSHTLKIRKPGVGSETAFGSQGWATAHPCPPSPNGAPARKTFSLCLALVFYVSVCFMNINIRSSVTPRSVGLGLMGMGVL